jgi:hypothetical protein
MYRAFAVGLIIILLGLAGKSIAEERPDPAKPKKSTTGAVFRSLAIPGWGQWYNDSRVKSIAFFATETFFAVGISRYHDKMMAAKKADVFVDERLFRSSRNKMIWWAAAIKLLSLGDAYVDAQLFKIDISPSLVPEDPSGMQISATVRF